MTKHSRSFILFFIIFLSFQLVGQDSYINTKGDTIIIEAIQTTLIYSKIEVVNQRIEGIKIKLQPTSQIHQIDSTIQKALKFLSTEEIRVNQTTSYANPREVADQQLIWATYYKDMKTWQEPITERSQLLVLESESVNFEIKTWQLTKKKAKEQNASQEMLTRIDIIIGEYVKLEDELKKQQDNIFNIQNQITDILIRVDAVINHLEKAKQDIRKQYFIPEAPPIWAKADSTFKEINVSKAWSNSIKKNIDQIANYFPVRINSIYIQLLIFLILLVFFIFLKNKIKSPLIKEENENYHNLVFLQKQYLLSAFMLSFISTIWLYPDAPLIFREVLQFFVLIPTFILLQNIIKVHFKPLLYAVLIIFLVDEFYFLFESSIHIARILLILMGVFYIWILIKLRNPKGKIRPLLQGKWWNIVLQLSFLIIIVLTVSILAAILGYLNISALLIRSIIDAFFMGIVVYLLVFIITSIIRVIFRVGLINGLNIIKKHNVIIQSWLISITNLLGVFVWLRSILISIGALGYVLIWINDFLDSSWEIGSVTISIGAIFGFFTALILTFIIFRLTRVILNDEVFTRVKLPRGVPGAISMIVGYFIVAVGIYIAISAAGVNLGQFGLIAGALGVGIGFGLQNIVFNFISGLILAFERPVQVGDTIEVGTLLGSIKSIGVRSSTVKTYDGSEVIVPNGNLISNEVINWTLSDRKRRRMIPVSVAYGSNPREVITLIYKAAEEHPEVLKNPKPWAIFDGFGESSLNFRIYFWVSYDRGMTIQSEIAMSIYDALEEASINIPFPQQDLHIKSIDKDFEEKLFQKPKTTKKAVLKKPEKED